MRRLLAVLLFCAGIFCLAQSHAQVPMTGAGLGAPASGGGGSSPAYTYLGNFSVAGLGSSSTTITSPITFPGSAGLLVVYFNISYATTVTSVVYDPTGANVTLHPDVTNNSNFSNGVWSGVVPAFTGSKNIVVTVSSSPQFQFYGLQAWLATNLTSSSVQQTATATGTSATISANSGYFMFGGAGSSASGINWATSTQTPFATHADSAPWAVGADWTLSSTGSYTLTPKSGTAIDQSYGTYH